MSKGAEYWPFDVIDPTAVLNDRVAVVEAAFETLAVNCWVCMDDRETLLGLTDTLIASTLSEKVLETLFKVAVSGTTESAFTELTCTVKVP